MGGFEGKVAIVTATRWRPNWETGRCRKAGRRRAGRRRVGGARHLGTNEEPTGEESGGHQGRTAAESPRAAGRGVVRPAPACHRRSL